MNKHFFAVVALPIGLATATATAGISNMSGDLALIPAPPSVQEGALENDDYAYIFVETTGMQLETALTVDISAPGEYNPDSILTPLELEPGTVINSYFIHQDCVEPGGERLGMEFEVTFEERIIGFAVLGDRLNRPSGTTLDDSDFIGEQNGTLYPKNIDKAYRGTLDTTMEDFVELTSDFHTLIVKWSCYLTSVEQLRVITIPTTVSETVCPDDPDDYQKWYGGPVTGNALDLCADDEVRMTVRQAAQVTPLLPFIRLEFWAYTSMSADTISQLDYHLNGHVSALVPGGQNANTLRTSIRNYNLGTFELKDQRATTYNADSDFHIVVDANAADYVNPGNGEIEVRQDVFNPGAAVSPLWYLKVDLYEVTITE